jgi:acetolactate synthase-1/2/3 large subunit
MALIELLARLPRHNRAARPSRRGDLAALHAAIEAEMEAVEPQASIGRALRREIPDDAIVVSEMTQFGYWADLAFPTGGPRDYITSGYQGTLGAGFATALGAQVANPGRRVVSINGDGGFMFNVQELATAAQHGIPLTAIVFDDGAFGNVRRIQERTFGGRMIASELRNPDLARLADSFGVTGIRAEGAEAVGDALRVAMRGSTPVLIQVPVGAMPPFRMQIRERLTRRLADAVGVTR